MRTSNLVDAARLVLNADTAADLMTANPVSLHHRAPVKEAVALFTDKGFNVAPVIDDAGRPIGVLSSSDIVVHDREKVDYLAPAEPAERMPMRTSSGEPLGRGFLVEKPDRTMVSDIMTPTVFAVSVKATASEVVAKLVELRVHHLFVVDRDGVLVGVISSLDILRRLG